MKRFVEGECRTQTILMAGGLDDYVSETNPVRVADVFVDEPDLPELGFSRAAPAVTGGPSYSPSVLLKPYIYGYLNRIQSSRRLEKEAQRNVEPMWLTGRLTPDFKNHRQFPQRQRQSDSRRVPPVCGVVPATRLVFRSPGRHRRQQIQGRQQP